MPDSSKAGVSRYVDTLKEAVTGTLKGGEEVHIRGFGRFSFCEQKARDSVAVGQSASPSPNVPLTSSVSSIIIAARNHNIL